MDGVGEAIDLLLRTNVEIWHQAGKVKKQGRPDRTLPTAERVKIFLEVRELNARRSALRWEIDKAFGGGANEGKLRYYKGGA